jgi:glutamate carboxypeptidase
MTDMLVEDYIKDQYDEQLRFIIDLCNQNSYTFNKEGTDRVARMIFDRLDGLLPIHEVHEESKVGSHHVLRTRGEEGAIYLLGHMDTVFPPDHPFQACRFDNDHLRGPGTGDMKGGLAVLVYAIRALHHLGVLDQLNLVLILSGDEEIGSATSRAIFEKERSKAAACLVAECGGAAGEFVISRNGKMGLRVDCHGRDRHVGSGTRRKASAILEMAHRIVALESLNGALPGVNVNAGKVEGGLGPATVPAHASCLIDVRWRAAKHESILRRMIDEKLSTPSQSGCRTTYQVINSRPAMPAKDSAIEIYKILQITGQRIGLEVVKSHRRGSSDANFFGAAGIPTLDGFGPVCHHDHTENEWILLSSIVPRTTILTLLLIDLGRRFGMIR